ncbi:hypothetical protein ccbrp13_62130 [Ktedonobacteria bacterium brp13]|nr:hypothetical protein ccbrp13_62130 [Ktedonobacteria bacterium brp13]
MIVCCLVRVVLEVVVDVLLLSCSPLVLILDAVSFHESWAVPGVFSSLPFL